MNTTTANDPFADRPPEGTAPFPFRFYVEFLEFLAAHPDIQIITYADLPWGGDFDAARGYPREKARWQRKLRLKLLSPKKIYVLVQNDVDTHPQRTEAVLRHHERTGIPANVMIFNRRVDRRHLVRTGELSLTPYELDDDYLRSLERKGFVFGYHMNAHERALFDMEKAQEIFSEDIVALRERFNIRFVTAHGGAPSPSGKNNRDVPMPAQYRNDMRWVHNGFSPFFKSTYSDGGLNSPLRDPTKRDLRDFVKSWKRGHRYRVLLHPQYYAEDINPSARLLLAQWYKDLLAHYSAPGAASVWKAIKV